MQKRLHVTVNVLGALGLLAASALLIAGCSAKSSPTASASQAPAQTAQSSAPAPSATASAPMPASAYNTTQNLPKWVDPASGYDTTREWAMKGGTWPILLALSPSQSPQLLYGFQAGLYQKKLAKFGITPTIEKLDGPPRVFHALERSKWPFAYVPLAVFMDYVRSPQNQGDAGGLQYVALAGSTSGGGYTLISKDPSIKTVADLKGKTVALQNTNPVPGTELTKAVENAGLKIGDGPNDVHIGFGMTGDQMNKYQAGKYDAMVTMNIYLAQLTKMGSHPITDFSDVGYRPNYTILVVDRSVLEQRPDVVKAFLEAHYEGDKLAEGPWKSGAAVNELLASWNGFFKGQKTSWSTQRPVPNAVAYKAMLGRMQPEIRLDRSLISDCFAFNTAHNNWGWPGAVDVSKVVDYQPFNDVLKANNVPLQ